MNVCERVFERYLIADTFACRKGNGRLVCLARAADFARRHPFFLKMDVRKYVESIPHDRLLENLTRLFEDPSLLLLLERINNNGQNCRPGNRNRNDPGNRDYYRGFRLALGWSSERAQ